MKKLSIGLVAVGAAMVLRPVLKRRPLQKIHEHCEQMMSQVAGRRETTRHEEKGQKMPEPCEVMAARFTLQRDRRQELSASSTTFKRVTMAKA